MSWPLRRSRRENAAVGICFMPVTDPKTVKNRVHLDLITAIETFTGGWNDRCQPLPTPRQPTNYSALPPR
jgi:hypothetical protein